MATTVPSFIRSLFTTFPLLLLPPLQPGPHPLPSSPFASPKNLTPIDPSLPTLYYLPNHALSISIHYFLVTHGILHNLQCSSIEANPRFPFLVPADSQDLLTDASLMQYITSSSSSSSSTDSHTGTQKETRNDADENEKGKGREVEEEAWILTIQAKFNNVITLAQRLDAQDTSLLSPLLAPLLSPFFSSASTTNSDALTEEVRAAGWTKTLRDFKSFLPILCTKLDTANGLPGAWCTAVLFGYLELIDSLTDWKGDRRMVDIRRLVKRRRELEKVREAGRRGNLDGRLRIDEMVG